MNFCPWYALSQSDARAPTEPGVFQVKVAAGLLEYPRGKSAMIHYGHGGDLRAAARAFDAQSPGNVWLCRHVVDANHERRFERVLDQFVSRFGVPPHVPTRGPV